MRTCTFKYELYGSPGLVQKVSERGESNWKQVRYSKAHAEEEGMRPDDLRAWREYAGCVINGWRLSDIPIKKTDINATITVKVGFEEFPLAAGYLPESMLGPDLWRFCLAKVILGGSRLRDQSKLYSTTYVVTLTLTIGQAD